MRVWALIAALGVSGCATPLLPPSADTIARIEAGRALLEDVQAVGVGDSEGMNRAARTRVQHVHCSLPEPDRAVCGYETARRGPGQQPQKQQRIFVRREPAPGEPGANGWALEDTARHRLQAAGQRPSLYDLGLYDPPQEPSLNATDIPPPPDPPDNETLFAHLAPGAWARALSAEGADTIRTAQIRKVTCVGLQTTYMLCAWEQKIGARWRRLSQYADISRVNDNVVVLKDRATIQP